MPSDDTKLSMVFDMVEKNKKQLNIEDYSISQTTLDEVFIGFAKLQAENIEETASVDHNKAEAVNDKNDLVSVGIMNKSYQSDETTCRQSPSTHSNTSYASSASL